MRRKENFLENMRKENEYFAPKFTNEELMRTWKTKKMQRPNKNHPYKRSYKLKM
jgi:hypothetical protein